MLRQKTPRNWSLARRKLVFGFSEKAVRKNLASVMFCGAHVTCHRKIHPSVKRIEARIRAAEKKHGWPKWSPHRVDCFNWRPIRGGTTLSRHSHAIAFDIDPATNKSYARYTGKETADIPVHVIQAFVDEGWTWGGDWNSPCDVMHFQYC